MRATRCILATVFAALASLAFFTGTGQAVPETIQAIVPGVWFREGDLKNLGHSNNILIEMADYLIVVDANFPSGARAMMADAKKVSPKPVRYVFDTHHHGDHAYGNAVWTEAGATTLAHQGVADEMKRFEPKRWQEAAGQRKDVKALNRTTAEPPKQTFDKTPFVLSDATRRVEFHFFGWAHTRGDGFVYLPKEQLICTGDAAVNGPYNYTNDANIANWPNVMRAASKLQIQRVLPGHGVPGGIEILRGQEAFMTELHKAVNSGIAKKQTLEQVQASLTLPDSVKNWVGQPFKTQISDVYQEITQKKPHGEIAGGK
jgi:cyclase